MVAAEWKRASNISRQEVMGELTLEQISEELLKCKLNAWEKIGLIEEDLSKREVR